MNKKLLFSTVSAVMSLGLLSACGVDNNRMNDTDDVNYSPVRYNPQNNNDVFDNDRSRNLNPNVDPVRFNPNNDLDLDMDNNRNNGGLLNDNDNDRNNRLFDNNQNNDNDLFDNDRTNNIPGTGGNMTGR